MLARRSSGGGSPWHAVQAAAALVVRIASAPLHQISTARVLAASARSDQFLLRVEQGRRRWRHRLWTRSAASARVRRRSARPVQHTGLMVAAISAARSQRAENTGTVRTVERSACSSCSRTTSSVRNRPRQGGDTRAQRAVPRPCASASRSAFYLASGDRRAIPGPGQQAIEGVTWLCRAPGSAPR